MILKTYTVEAFDGDGYALVLCTINEKHVRTVSPTDFDTHLLVVKTWEEDMVINQYPIELSKLF